MPNTPSQKTRKQEPDEEKRERRGAESPLPKVKKRDYIMAGKPIATKPHIVLTQMDKRLEEKTKEFKKQDFFEFLKLGLGPSHAIPNLVAGKTNERSLTDLSVRQVADAYRKGEVVVSKETAEIVTSFVRDLNKAARKIYG